MVPFKSLGTVSYLPFTATMAVSLAVSEIFSIKYCQTGMTLKLGLGVVQDCWKWHYSESGKRSLYFMGNIRTHFSSTCCYEYG